ncbi:LysE family translocator [Belnapia sp. T6]|uniref:LysE family translocator n=1 Tax=Belnapia mucosa TaxID=2804532 RepID=A0ABS1V4V7_9PROT|nr:LysE family translocator [Belnapia mucosa]MBL6456734.1 LysE family translocator [Belnapia mucosa]
MEAAWLASATGFALAMSATPGPNNAMVAASAVNFGLRRSLPHMLGVSIGFPAMLVLVALGAGEVLAASPGLQAALRWVGAAWMLWLAWKIATAAPAAPGATPRGRPLTLLQAALFQWVNPKAWVIAGAAILAYGASPLLAAIFGLAAFGSLLLWALVGLGAARVLRRPGALVWFNRAMAALLVLSLVPVLRG